MTQKSSPYDGFRAMGITRDGKRNLESLMRELEPQIHEPSHPTDLAFSRRDQVYQTDKTPSQESRIAALENKIQTMDQAHKELERQIENLREEMRRLVYRFE